MQPDAKTQKSSLVIGNWVAHTTQKLSIHTNWQPQRLWKRIKRHTRWRKALSSSALAANFSLPVSYSLRKGSMCGSIYFRFLSTGKVDFWSSCVVHRQICPHSAAARAEWNMAQLPNNLARKVRPTGRPLRIRLPRLHNRTTVAQSLHHWLSNWMSLNLQGSGVAPNTMHHLASSYIHWVKTAHRCIPSLKMNYNVIVALWSQHGSKSCVHISKCTSWWYKKNITSASFR